MEEEEEDGTDQGRAHRHEEEEEEAMADMTIAIIETTIIEEEEGEVRVQHARFRDFAPPPAALLSRTAHHPPPLFRTAGRSWSRSRSSPAAEEAAAPHVPTPRSAPSPRRSPSPAAYDKNAVQAALAASRARLGVLQGAGMSGFPPGMMPPGMGMAGCRRCNSQV